MKTPLGHFLKKHAICFLYSYNVKEKRCKVSKKERFEHIFSGKK